MTLLARIKVHSQQVCGLAWAPSGRQFATGSNDNLCCLFHPEKIIDESETTTSTAGTSRQRAPHAPPQMSPLSGPIAARAFDDGGYLTPPRSPTSATSGPQDLASELAAAALNVRHLPAGSERHRWRHLAAVKAIAFCPWQEGLVATGGGSNDRCIHFFHTTSGAALATISVSAQVTSLIWSTTRREIAATFGYAQPDHPYRIAVFSWPDCRQVAAIPWEGEHRALYAIAFPGGPSDTYRARESRRSRTAEEGCIVVAGSDESVKFHEVWMAGSKATALGSGVLAGSDILEMGEGIDKDGEVIR